MQTDTQTVQRQPYPNRYRKGRSGNPGGKSRAQLHLEAFMALYVETHQRKPNAVESALLKTAAQCAARAQDRRRSQVEHIVRCGRLLQQLLNVLGLAGQPSKADPFAKSPLEALRDHKP
jgi:hypothetical protein